MKIQIKFSIVERFYCLCSGPLQVVTSVTFLQLCCRYIHPLENRECPVVLGGDYITTESGTGLVHTAPGHGIEDFKTGLKYGLPVLSPVDDSGKFTEEAGQFATLDVLGDGNTAVMKALDNSWSLIMEEAYSMFLSSFSVDNEFHFLLL
jgi:isoleucyl-tRNA synthetase